MADVTIKSKGFFSITAILAVVTSIVTVSIWAGGLEREVKAHEAAIIALQEGVTKDIVRGRMTMLPYERHLLAIILGERVTLNSSTIRATNVRFASVSAKIRFHFDLSRVGVYDGCLPCPLPQAYCGFEGRLSLRR